MDSHALPQYLKQPEIRHRLLGGYGGAMALGVTADPRDPSRSAINLRVSGSDISWIPKTIVINGEEVTVVVHANFRAPQR